MEDSICEVCGADLSLGTLIPIIIDMRLCIECPNCLQRIDITINTSSDIIMVGENE